MGWAILDFESSASTNSATSAFENILEIFVFQIAQILKTYLIENIHRPKFVEQSLRHFSLLDQLGLTLLNLWCVILDPLSFL